MKRFHSYSNIIIMLSRITKIWMLTTVALSQLVRGNQAESSSNELARYIQNNDADNTLPPAAITIRDNTITQPMRPSLIHELIIGLSDPEMKTQLMNFIRASIDKYSQQLTQHKLLRIRPTTIAHSPIFSERASLRAHTALGLAIEMNNAELINLLLAQDPDLIYLPTGPHDQLPLMLAIDGSYDNAVHAILQHDPTLMHAPYLHHRLAIEYAVENRDANIIAVFIRNGYDMQTPFSNRETIVARIRTIATAEPAFLQALRNNPTTLSLANTVNSRNANDTELSSSERWGLKLTLICLLSGGIIAIHTILDRCLSRKIRAIEENLEKAEAKIIEKKASQSRRPRQRILSQPYQPKVMTDAMRKTLFPTSQRQVKQENTTDNSEIRQSIEQSYKRVKEYCDALNQTIPHDAQIARAAKNCSREDLIKHKDNIAEIENVLRKQSNERKEPRNNQSTLATTTVVSQSLKIQPQKKHEPTENNKTDTGKKLNPRAKPFELPTRPPSSSSSDWDELNRDINKFVFNS